MGFILSLLINMIIMFFNFIVFVFPYLIVPLDFVFIGLIITNAMTKAFPGIHIGFIIAAITIVCTFDDNEYRIVLTWGEAPRDLDSHLEGEINGAKFHVYYSNKTFAYKNEIIAQLDIDDTSSYGPETTTITFKDYGGNFEFYVVDYTNRNNSQSDAMSKSSAKVQVYKGSELIQTYIIPKEQKGTKWSVFTLLGGRFIHTNKIS